MKHFLVILCALAVTNGAHAAPASAESVSTLLDVMHAEQASAAVLRSIDGVMQNAMAQSAKNLAKPLTPEQTAKVDALRVQLIEIMKDELSWEKMKPLNIQVYSETFSQEDVDGLIAFYRSPSGQAYVAKMPAAMQKSMALMQQRMGPMMQRFSQAMKEALPANEPAKATP